MVIRECTSGLLRCYQSPPCSLGLLLVNARLPFQKCSNPEELKKVFRDRLVHFSDRPFWLPSSRFPLFSFPGLSSLLLSRILFAPIWLFSLLAWSLDELELPVRDTRD